MTTGHLRGHEIEFIDESWVYSDTKESTESTHRLRACVKCGKHGTKEGHDACLGTFAGVENACCGHGIKSDSYIQFSNGIMIRGFETYTNGEEMTLQGVTIYRCAYCGAIEEVDSIASYAIAVPQHAHAGVIYIFDNIASAKEPENKYAKHA